MYIVRIWILINLFAYKIHVLILFVFKLVAVMDLNFEHEIEWEVCEIDVKKLCLDNILYYLKNRLLNYYWMLLYHDGTVECEIVDETGSKVQYYHMFVWFHKKAVSLEKKQYFSNLPFMQYVRRIYQKWGEIVYPHVLNHHDIIPRLMSLIKSGHPYVKNASNVPWWIKETMKEYLVLGKIIFFFFTS